jgi:RNase H-fold protein (predicted Holliday junction resolvase)
MVGYPLNNKNEHTQHCMFVEKFIEHMWVNEKVRVPVTLVNEFNSSMEAKAKIAELVQNS